MVKDEIDNKVLIINSSEIKNNFLIDNFITEFDENYCSKKLSKKIDVSNKEWIIYDAKIYKKNNYETKSLLKIKTNFD